jgi:hypothetical protein
VFSPLSSPNTAAPASGSAEAVAAFRLIYLNGARAEPASLVAYPEGSPVPQTFPELIPSADEVRAEASVRAAERANQFIRSLVETEREKRELIDKLSGSATDREKLDALSSIIRRAAENGLDEVLLYRFPAICRDDDGPGTIGAEGWEERLTGEPKRIHDLWAEYLKPLGYGIRYLSLPADRDGNIHVVLSWGE